MVLTRRPFLQRGFTLIELAIVILIIGLLMAGFLKGQEMITQTRLKRTIQRLNGYYSAANAFHDKYECLPGDCIKAQFYLGTGTTNGDGDKIIDSFTAESPSFWQQLSMTGFITGDAMDGFLGAITPGENAPTTDFNQGTFVVRDMRLWGRYSNVIEYGLPAAGAVYQANGPFLTPNQAQYIDEKMDDGRAEQGDIMCTDAGAQICSAAASTTGTGANYQITVPEIAACTCAYFIKF